MSKLFFHRIKAWLKSLTKSKPEVMDSPWQEYETLSLVPLEEIEEMVKDELAKKQAAKQEKEKTYDTQLPNRDALSSVTHTTSSAPHVADLSHHYTTLPTVITCFSTEEEGDPNMRITHYPPSNALH